MLMYTLYTLYNNGIYIYIRIYYIHQIPPVLHTLYSNEKRRPDLIVIYVYLCASIFIGLAMNQIELEKISDHFDRDHDGYIDLSEISSILRGIRRARSLAKRQPVSDSEKIDHEVSQATITILPAVE